MFFRGVQKGCQNVVLQQHFRMWFWTKRVEREISSVWAPEFRWHFGRNPENCWKSGVRFQGLHSVFWRFAWIAIEIQRFWWKFWWNLGGPPESAYCLTKKGGSEGSNFDGFHENFGSNPLDRWPKSEGVVPRGCPKSREIIGRNERALFGGPRNSLKFSGQIPGARGGVLVIFMNFEWNCVKIVKFW